MKICSAMETKQKFEHLKELELNAYSNKERARIQQEFDKLADADPEGFEMAFIESARSTLNRAKKLAESRHD
jgi:hypothetical protein